MPIFLKILFSCIFFITYPNLDISSYAILNEKYYLVVVDNYINDDFGNRGLSYNCIKIFKDITLTQQFCFNVNAIIKIVNKMPFFTIETLQQNRIGETTNTYLTFQLINDKFYLYQYSKKEWHMYKDKEAIDNIFIYYRQPRDLQNKKLILLDNVNDELLQNLEESK
ncbi:hypothetical protein FMM56_01580 [Campylobacter sp. LR264d]|uniref:hypothetical protein n=1 Tax=Campylobacter sp. LR264d TaxID=2593544 RepID=UPI00123A8542|nr:hypothetical protein [Campylobacter sp. LR264d]KAA6233993.1 hypothetical protein FMM56_01580 [Campylobacter sp. LR264d]